MSVNPDQMKAGRIAAKTREMVENHNIVDHSILEICYLVEEKIRNLGGEPAFPCNVSINEVAAHCTAGLDDDDETVSEGDMVKIDLGVHVNGYIADTATTVSYNPEYDTLTQAAEEALNAAIRTVRKDVSAGEIGRAISETAERWGFRPITNLTGHSTAQYRVHAGVSIPNVWMPGTPRLKVSSIYAIEPFLTLKDGAGSVVEGGEPRIFSLVSRKRTGKKPLDGLIEEIWRSRRTLPFTPRWYLHLFDKDDLKRIIDELVKRRILKGYPILVEKKGRHVSQFEHTVTPTETGVVVIT
ncbi:MAG: type II methionyl aminopeptidase [Nitrososphaerales archaeon]